MIYYIGYYGNNRCREKRSYVLAATNKMDYIVEALNQCGESVEIVSMSSCTDQFSKAYTYSDFGTKIHMLASLNPSCGVIRVANRMLMRIQLLAMLLKLKRSDTVLVYHSLGYMKEIALAKAIKKFGLILEVEEIYGDVIGDQKIVSQELCFFKNADAFVFPTSLLDEKINCSGKPVALIHGTYKVEPCREDKGITHDVRSDGSRMIHCVYAGTFDPRKGGVAAAAAAEFLPSNYHVHILGFGNKKDTKLMQDTVNEVAKKTKATVTYDGLLSGEEYIRFIQNCDIGLSTQNPDAAFNATSFPSKILSYMANGLRVVSIRIPAIELSAVGKALYYYKTQTPEEIAKAIMHIDLNDGYDGRCVIEKLDKEFQRELKNLLAALK